MTDNTAPSLSDPTTNVLDGLTIGSKVEIRRNLDHPAWKKRAEDGVVIHELVGIGTVIQTRRGSYNSSGAWKGSPRDEVRIDNTLWYEEDGFQTGSGATYIVPLPQG